MIFKNSILKRNNVFIIFACLFMVVLLVTTKFSAWCAESVPSEVLLSFTGDTKTSCSITFNMPQNSSCAQVQYMENNEYNGSFLGSYSVSAQKSIDSKDILRFEATMNCLKPGTEYIYRVGCNNCWSKPSIFRTAKENERNFSFIYMGDSQANPEDNSYREWGNLLKTSYNEKSNPRFILMGGDLVNDGNDFSEWKSFFDETEGVFDKIPLMPAMGNHDNTGLYKKNFALPKNGPAGKEEEYYSFDYGNVHFIVLDSNSMGNVNEEDINWLISDLKNCDKTWKIAMFHHPAYVINSNPKDITRAETIKDAFIPILEKYGVDLVLNGHQHAYMRTYPIKNGEIKEHCNDGIVYIMGVSGNKGYSVADYDYIAVSNSDFGVYTEIKVKDSELNIITKNVNGSEIDNYSIKKGRDIVDNNSLILNAFSKLPYIITEKSELTKTAINMPLWVLVEILVNDLK